MRNFLILMFVAVFTCNGLMANDGEMSFLKVKTIKSLELINRFENQFNDLFNDVEFVKAYFVKERGYCYAVYGLNKDNESVVEYFKTTKEEVETETYNYICESIVKR